MCKARLKTAAGIELATSYLNMTSCGPVLDRRTSTEGNLYSAQVRIRAPHGAGHS